MERRFRVRLDDPLAGAEVRPGLPRGALSRSEAFLQPFADALRTPGQRVNARQYVQGLLSDLGSKDAEPIACLHDRDRQGIQKFIGQADWDHRPPLAELARQVRAAPGEAGGVLVFDPSSFPKKGAQSAGVARQWCGRLGEAENCQVGVHLAYASREEHAPVDCRLHLPEGWAKGRERREKAGVPKAARSRTRHEPPLEMLDERGPLLPHGRVAGDDEMGRRPWFRRELRRRGERDPLAVPSNTLVRDLRAAEPTYAGRGRPPKPPFVRADRRRAALPESAWVTVEVRDGERGPLAVQAVWTLAQAGTGGKASDAAESPVAFREERADGTFKHDDLLSDAVLGDPLPESARVHGAEHRAEDCPKRAKSEAGLGGYQVRTWEGWHHHQCLSLLATWFLTEEARRGKRRTPALTVPQVRAMIAGLLKRALNADRPERIRRAMNRRLRRDEEARLYHWRRRKLLPPLRPNQRT